MNDTPSDWREARRFRAFDLNQEGWKQKGIAEALGVSEGAVSQWIRRAREGGGKEALRTRKPPGRPPALSEEELRQLPGLLKKGPEHFGFRGTVWTRSLDAQPRGGSHPPHLRRLILRFPRWSAPAEDGLESAEAGPARLPARCLPARRGGHPDVEGRRLAPYQKKAEAEDRTVMFVDEAGFYVLPSVVRTWAPCGETPVLKAPLLWEHLSVIGAITPGGKLYGQAYERAIRGPDVVRFLRHLLGHIEGKITVVWDGLPAHRGKKVKRFLQEGAAARIHLEQLPGYAPDLNPKEGIWNYLKRVELKNLCCRHLGMLKTELRKARERLRHKTDVIKACFRQVGLV